MSLLLAGAILSLLAGHIFKGLRWRLFVGLYETVPLSLLTGSLAAGYLVSFYLPLHLGEVLRLWLSGRKMDNGMGYAMATIAVDRTLDVLAMTVMFGAMAVLWPQAAIRQTAWHYALLLVLLALLFTLAGIFNRRCKQAALWISSLFNEGIRFKLLFFFWALISSFKDMFRKVRKGSLLLYTVLMWAAYLLSYGLIVQLLRRLSYGTDFGDMMLMMFSGRSLLQSTFAVTRPTFGLYTGLLLALWILAPLVILCLVWLTSPLRKKAGPTKVSQLLPQLKPDEQMLFLESYFEGKDRSAIQEYLTMNADVGIVRDYSSGSDAKTLLCVREDEIYFRKYAVGGAVAKLADQAAWIKAHADALPLPEIALEKRSAQAYCYDMRYRREGVELFQYTCAHPARESWAILEAVLTDLQTGLYGRPDRKVGGEEIAAYWRGKVRDNLALLNQAKPLRDLVATDWLTINGIRYRNLPLLADMLSQRRLQEVFAQDPIAPVHGDLTLQNIICYVGQEGERPYYLIDPNTGSPYETPYLDYAKLLQSLHGKYEFLDQGRPAKTGKGRLDFLLPDTSQHRDLYRRMDQWLTQTLSPAGVRSVYYHEMVHWLRLMPYRLRRSEETAARYYGAMILVMNDIYQRFEETP